MVSQEGFILVEEHIRTPGRHKHTVHGPVVRSEGEWKRGERSVLHSGRPLTAFDNGQRRPVTALIAFSGVSEKSNIETKMIESDNALAKRIR